MAVSSSSFIIFTIFIIFMIFFFICCIFITATYQYKGNGAEKSRLRETRS